MKRNLKDIFEVKKLTNKPLFILEMANNHMGDVKHGLKILRDFYEITKNSDFTFAFKFQYRDIDTFIHPDYVNRLDLKYVKRFKETRLSPNDFLILKNEADKLGFITICTPFDEKSVDLIEKHNFSIIKIGSCSFGDWPLLERIAKTDKPLIVSSGGASLETIDNVVSFFCHRNKTMALMHCVGEYPTLENNLELNQICLFKDRYAGIPIGFSTHEEPENVLPVMIAISKGAQIFERHVAIKSDKYEVNAYSSTPEQISKWIEAASRALNVGGVVGMRSKHSEKEMADIRQFQRGVFVREAVKKGETIEQKNMFYAFPNQEKQLVANDVSKYINYVATKDIDKNGPVVDYSKDDLRSKVYEVVKKIDKLLSKSGVIIPSRADLEISHHYGIDSFYKFGMCIITCVNRDYCKKLLVMLPGQKHPTQYHKLKEETFHILYGKYVVILNGKRKTYVPGDIITVKPGVKHSFTTLNGGILEEISSTHFVNDSYYIDKKIALNKNRKTYVNFWRNVI